MISFFDTISILVFIITGIFVVIKHKQIKQHISSYFPIVSLCIVSGLYALTLFIEWYGISSLLDHYEDILGALIPMFWIFLFYALIAHQQNADVRISEERMQLAIKGTLAGLWDWQVQTGELIINDRWAELIGYSIAELHPISFETWAMYIHPSDLEFANNALQQHFANKTEYYECEVRMKHKNGQWVWIHTRGIVVERDIHGKPLRMTGTHVDVTDKKNNQLELEQYRINLEYLVQERTEEIATVNEELRAINEEVYEKNEKINLQNAKLQETLLHLQTTQMQLIQSEKMASLGVLTAGVAHEINNPLNFIHGGYVGLDNYFKDPNSVPADKIPMLLNCISVGVERASAIVQSLNQFSRNKDNFDEVCDIADILDNCLIMLYNKTKDNIIVSKEFIDKQCNVRGNAGQLHQVFINIINNAIQAIAKKGTIAINLNRIDKFVIIEIIDSGCGIKPENISRVTDPFFTTKDPGQGTGLGLSITYSIIKDHDGFLEFDSEVDKGTRVKVTLPINRTNG